jgi:hypothetical protein
MASLARMNTDSVESPSPCRLMTAPVPGHRPGDQLLVSGQGGPHGGAMALPQRRGRLDVGEQEGHDALGKLAGLAHGPPSYSQPALRAILMASMRLRPPTLAMALER